jgi:hypothetical protein
MPFILLIIGFVLIIYNYRAIKKENEIKKENDGFNISFQSVLQDSKAELNDYKMEIGLLRRDVAESLTELQEEIIEIKNSLNKLKNNERVYENKGDLENDYFLNEYDIDTNISSGDNKENPEKVKKFGLVHNNIVAVDDEYTDAIVNSDVEDGVISEINFSEKVDSNKTQNIKRLLKDGLTEEEICRKLSVSKGEVLLVKGLFKK